jgi:predicted HTH transcriptional regulator
MKNGCLADGLPEPELEVEPRIFSVCFHIRDNNKALREMTGGHSGELNGDDSGEKSGDTTKHTVIIDKNNEKLSGEKCGVGDVRQEIMRLMIEDPRISAKRIAEIAGLNPRKVESDIRALKKAGKIERAGADRKGVWIVKR